MKKFNLNSNKTKLIARVMLLVLLVVCQINLYSCTVPFEKDPILVQCNIEATRYIEINKNQRVNINMDDVLNIKNINSVLFVLGVNVSASTHVMYLTTAEMRQIFNEYSGKRDFIIDDTIEIGTYSNGYEFHITYNNGTSLILYVINNAFYLITPHHKYYSC